MALFAGAGGGILGGYLLGWETICAVEIEDYPRRVLLARQRDGILPRFPIWDDITTFDGTEWRGRVDVVSGGFPCQDISCAGGGEGIEGSRSGLWAEMARVIGEVQPAFVFVENSPMLTSRGLGRVLGDLACLGYDSGRGIFTACEVGADHERKRLWILAHAHRRNGSLRRNMAGARRLKQSVSLPSDAHSRQARLQRGGEAVQNGTHEVRECAWNRFANILESVISADGGLHRSVVGRGVHGVAHRVDRLKALGNGQVPAVARLAWEVLGENIC